MILCAISDLHGRFPIIEPCDLLLIAGDICPTYNHDVAYQAHWLDKHFRKFLDKIPAKNVVGIFGNHDFVGQQNPSLIPKNLRWDCLNCSSTQVGKLKIYGNPWSLWFHDWAFNAPVYGGEEFLKEMYDQIPVDSDIIISHGPVYGFGDAVIGPVQAADPHVGSRALLDALKALQPRLFVTGHIHEGHGVGALGPTLMCNASILNEQYKQVHEPFYFQSDEGGILQLKK